MNLAPASWSAAALCRFGVRCEFGAKAPAAAAPKRRYGAPRRREDWRSPKGRSWRAREFGIQLSACLTTWALALATTQGVLAAETKVDFTQQILPIFKQACFECHGSAKQKGKLRLDQREAGLQGGKSGSTIVPGKADESEIYKRILLPKGNDDRMPNEGEPLAKAQTDLIRDWINQGANWPEESKGAASATGKPATKRGKTDLEIAAADLLPPERSLSEVIDHYVDAKLAQTGVAPAPQADGATLVRRLMLDLAGRIPSREDAEAYIDAKEPQKRAQLTDRLMATPWFWRHTATELNAMLRGIDSSGPDLRGYMLTAMRENRPWDRIFRELLGEESDPQGPEQFVTKRLKDPDLLTRDVSSLFFGINLSCCQCHTHPYVDTLTQDYFLGMKNFFSRSYEFQGTLREKQFGSGEVEFKTRGGKAKKVGLLFINGAVVDAPQSNVRDLTKAIQDENKRIEDLKKNFDKTKEFPPEAFFSLRRQLVKTAELPDNQILLARSIVNRLWSRFYGYGLVMRVDQMHTENAASHPELLRWLTRDLIAHRWDLRRLIQGLVSSRAYSRSSRWKGNPAPAQELFAVANLRPLTPMQFGLSVLLLGNPEFSSVCSTQDPPAALEKKLESLERSAETNFASIIERPGEGFQIGIDEPLGMSNDPERLKLIGASLAARLAKLPDRRQQVEGAVWTVLGRPPTESELKLLGHYLTRHSTVAENERAELAAAVNAQRLGPALSLSNGVQSARTSVEGTPSEATEAKTLATTATPSVPGDITSKDALDQLVWGLVSAAEFRFIH